MAGVSFMLRRFLNFFGISQQPPPLRVLPSHADGTPMKSLEQHVWTMMQKVVETHGPEIARNEGPGVYNPSPAYRGVLVYIESESQLSCFCASGKWEATFTDGFVGVPRKIKDYGEAAQEQSRVPVISQLFFANEHICE
jgi:hypothetical protein